MTALDRGAAPGLDPIDEHVAALAGALHGPVRVKERMLTEARDALIDAAADIAEGGASTAAPHARRSTTSGASRTSRPPSSGSSPSPRPATPRAASRSSCRS
ncbi:hypothetical protein SAZ11_23630 [Streptomyces sp. FXJ1.4098]|nr:hypothetical protein [Streptomyces sp. FXJ1.4098]